MIRISTSGAKLRSLLRIPDHVRWPDGFAVQFAVVAGVPEHPLPLLPQFGANCPLISN
jgi:hypothetical protein